MSALRTAIPGPAARSIWRAYNGNSANPNSFDTLVEQHLSLVKTTVDRMYLFLPAVLDAEDLYSAGIAGLMAAARKFDPTLGASFSSYAILHIRGAVHDELRRMDWLPRSRRDKAKRLQEVINEIEQRKGRPALSEEICGELGITVEQYETLLMEARPVTFLPLDGEILGEGRDDLTLHDVIADQSQATAAEEMDRKELHRLVLEHIQKLPDTAKKVLVMYYFEGFRVAEIAKAFGVTEGRISQIHTQAVLSLRGHIQRLTKTPCS